LTEDFIPQMATFWNRSLWVTAGELDKARHLAMDYDLFLRFARVAKPAVSAAYLADFRVHQEAKSTLQVDEHLAEALSTVRDHAADLGWRGKLSLLLHRIYAETVRHVLNPETFARLGLPPARVYDTVSKVLFEGILTDKARKEPS
jgi:hypothetical protein